jgi:hypothetical protein
VIGNSTTAGQARHDESRRARRPGEDRVLRAGTEVVMDAICRGNGFEPPVICTPLELDVACIEVDPRTDEGACVTDDLGGEPALRRHVGQRAQEHADVC